MMIFVGIFLALVLVAGVVVGIGAHRAARAVTWPFRRAAEEWRCGRRTPAIVMWMFCAAYVVAFLVWLNRQPSPSIWPLIWVEVGIALAIALTPLILAPRPRPASSTPYPPDHPGMTEGQWRQQ